MLTVQGKTGLAVVKGGATPARRGVAGGAVGTEGAVVGIVLAMTADAGARGAGELPVGMAALTESVAVLTVQGKTGLGVVKGSA